MQSPRRRVALHRSRSRRRTGRGRVGGAWASGGADSPDDPPAQPDPTRPVGEEAEAGELPPAVLGVVGEQPPGGASAGPAGEPELAGLVLGHRDPWCPTTAPHSAERCSRADAPHRVPVDARRRRDRRERDALTRSPPGGPGAYVRGT